MTAQEGAAPVELDSRIAAIMMALSNSTGNGAQKDAASQSPKESAAVVPTTLEQYMEIEGLADWPQFVTSEYPLTHEADFILGSQSDVLELLKEAAPLEEQLAILDGLEEKVLGLEAALMKYASQILTDEPRSSRIEQGTFYSNIDKVFLTEPAAGAESTRKKTDVIAGALMERKKKDVNFCTFPGFRRKELTELPAQLEVPQLLHRVTKAQSFKNSGFGTGFAKFWKKIFLSEASIAIVHDLFWWMFLKMFKPGTESSQSQLFDRLADSFAALFFSIHSDMKDKIFKVYPDMLAQAIFTIFNEAFPESRRMFGPMFKQELVNYCWELTSGVRPPPGSWRSWDVDRLMNDTDGDDLGSKYSKLDKPTYDFDGLYKMIAAMDGADEALLTVARDGAATKPGAASNETAAAAAAAATAAPAAVSSKAVEPRESVQSGPGPKVEKSLFSLAGLSPLMAHFLSAKQLREPAQVGTKVRRTEVVSLPPPAPTYQEIIQEAQQKVKERRANHEKFCKEKTAEIVQIEKRKNQMSREIEKIKDEIKWMHVDGHDLKLFADTLVAKLTDQSAKRAVQPARLPINGGFTRGPPSDYSSEDEDLESDRVAKSAATAPSDISSDTTDAVPRVEMANRQYKARDIAKTASSMTASENSDST